MIVGKGVKSGLEISPVAKKTQLISSVGENGEVATPSISFKKIKNYIVVDGKRTIEVDDLLEGAVGGELSINITDIDPQLVKNLNDSIVAIFDAHYIKEVQDEES